MIGQTISHYKITSKLGEGGMGEVYRATDTKLHRDVALKVLPEAFVSDRERMARFSREAQVLASLNHPNIASIYGLEDSDDKHALVLELVEGETLAERIQKGAIPPEGSLKTALQIAEALEAAHEKGIIHRDLKPANVKITPEGKGKVLDFGLAKALEDETPVSDLTSSPTRTGTAVGVIMGTAGYMSPEQARGQTVDKRTDIWAFGCVLYEMLTGKQVFGGETATDILGAIVHKDPDWEALPEGTPRAIQRLLRRCLERDPYERLRDIGDARIVVKYVLAEAVEDSAAGVATATPVTDAMVRQGTGWRQPLPLAVGLMVGSLITGLAAWKLIAPDTEPSRVTRFTVTPDETLTIGVRVPDVAISPNGQRIAYLVGGTPQGAEQLRVRSLDELSASTLVSNGAALSPFFSDDGTWVGFYDRLGREALKKINVRGGSASVICELPSGFWGASWGPNNTIIYADDRGLWRVSAAGGTPEPLTEAKERSSIFWPEILPGGEAVLFTIRRPSGFAIAALSLDTLESSVVVPAGSLPKYLPSGFLVYALEGSLWAIEFDPISLKTQGSPVPVLEGVLMKRTGAASYAVSRTGSLAYLTDYRSGVTASLMWVDRRGAATVVDTIPPGAYQRPRLSPDGDRVLVVADSDLWVYDLASGRQSRLTNDGKTRTYAGWTPSGADVTYSSKRGSEEGVNIWMQAADGSGAARQVTALEGSLHFDSWAPDGQTFAAHHHSAHDGVLTSNQLMVPLNGEPETWLGREFHESNSSSAVFSPDGRYVALVSDQTGQREVYIRPFPGPGGQTPVSVGGGEEPAWARNGELFYRRPSDYAMMAVEVETDLVLTVGPPRELFRGTYYPAGSPRARYTVTAHGQMFLMRRDFVASGEAGERGPRFVVVQNWHEELKRLVPKE